MKTLTMITIAAMLESSAWAAGKAEPQKVVVCVEGDGQAKVADSMSRATLLFKPAGVKLEWHSGLSFCQGQANQAIVVSLSTGTPKAFHPGTFAYALPYERVHIKVFYDRIALHNYDDLLSYVLAHVYVHEIAHILQGMNRHSNSGIMKAFWSPDDYILMKASQLRFTELDIEMIHAGLAARAARPALGTLVAPVAP